jgi:hypothetical protein
MGGWSFPADAARLAASWHGGGIPVKLRGEYLSGLAWRILLAHRNAEETL